MGRFAGLAIVDLPEGVEFGVKATPGASRSRIVGLLGPELKVAVAAPASGGQANAAICALLAGALGVRRGDVEICTGLASPRKRLRVRGLTAAELKGRLEELG